MTSSGGIFLLLHEWLRKVEQCTGEKPPAVVLPDVAADMLQAELGGLVGTLKPQPIGGGLVYWGIYQGVIIYTLTL